MLLMENLQVFLTSQKWEYWKENKSKNICFQYKDILSNEMKDLSSRVVFSY